MLFLIPQLRHLKIEFMASTTIIFGWFVGVMAELALYLSQMGFMRVWYNFLCPFSKFALISVTLGTDLCRNQPLWWIFFMTTLTSDTGDFVFIR